MSAYGNLGEFIQADERPRTAPPVAEVRKVEAVAPRRVRAPVEEPDVEKAPADYVEDSYAAMFGMTRRAAEKGHPVRMEMPCGDCIFEMARAMAGG
jgi:hypothetical protein